jgi:hypothetical protein
MNFVYLLYLLPFLVDCEKIIKNVNVPACRNCIHYQPDPYNNDFTSMLNKCNKFGNKNIITDKITYDFADSCRMDESKCGKEGKYFVEEPNINMKILKYSIFKNIPNGIFIFMICSLIFLQIYAIYNN